MPGPRGCRTTLLELSWLPFNGAELIGVGRLGTGGTDPLPKGLPLENKEPNPVETRRDGEAMVAYPSRILPLEARELRRGAWECNVFMSGMDFLARRELEVIWLEGVKYAEGARERVWGTGRWLCCWL